MKFEPNALLLFRHKKELPGTEPRPQLAAKARTRGVGGNFSS